MRPFPRLPVPAILAALAALLLPGAAGAEVVQDLRYVYYDVDARPGPLYPQVQAASPVRRDGRTFSGNTNWNIRWQYDFGRDPAGLLSLIHI